MIVATIAHTFFVAGVIIFSIWFWLNFGVSSIFLTPQEHETWHNHPTNLSIGLKFLRWTMNHFWLPLIIAVECILIASWVAVVFG